VKYISHLDIMRLWQRALHRAEMPPLYSEGFSPHPRISLAAPLPLGVTSQAELMDIYCSSGVSPHAFNSAVSRQLPEDIGILQVYQVGLTLPSLQAQVRYADYSVRVSTEKDGREIELMLTSMLSLEQLPWQHQRDTGLHHYDLRTLIDDLWLMEWHEGQCTIGMRLRCGSHGSGRPEQVVAALGFTDYPQSIHRTGLILETS
jgi:radical SAM-linked protein